MKPQTRELNWKELVQRSWGKDWNKPDIAYEFTGHTFYDHPVDWSGISIGGSQYADNYADNWA